MSKLSKIFQTKQDSEKHNNKHGHNKDAIPSDNEGKNILILSTSHRCSKQSRAQMNRNQTTVDILPTDDPA